MRILLISINKFDDKEGLIPFLLVSKLFSVSKLDSKSCWRVVSINWLLLMVPKRLGPSLKSFAWYPLILPLAHHHLRSFTNLILQHLSTINGSFCFFDQIYLYNLRQLNLFWNTFFPLFHSHLNLNFLMKVCKTVMSNGLDMRELIAGWFNDVFSCNWKVNY